ncbi:MAG: hypothetical protein F7B61_06240 [Caldisphaeraceae archaeon]|nr:hypothetical protein [Caldisphaeraceae archaeon]
MPRKRKNEGEKIKQNGEKPKRKGRKKSKARLSEVEIESYADEISRQLVPMLGLDIIEVDASSIKGLVSEIVAAIAESRVTKPTINSIVKKMIASKNNFMKAIASTLISSNEVNSRERLEFLISYAPELAGKASPILYKTAKKLNLQDVIEDLRHLWNLYGRPTPVRCPRCGFNSVMPDLTCIVCNATLSEKEIKDEIGFNELLNNIVSTYNREVIYEIIHAGYVVFDGELKPPSMANNDSIEIILHLSREEREALKKTIESYKQ